MRALKCPSILEELEEFSYSSLVQESGVDVETARLAAAKIVARFQREFGGAKVYIPVRKRSVMVMRRDIYRRWNGVNTRQLCRELEISESRLRTLYDEAVAERAGELPKAPARKLSPS